MRQSLPSVLTTKTGAIDTTFGSNGIDTCRWLRDICGVEISLKLILTLQIQILIFASPGI